MLSSPTTKDAYTYSSWNYNFNKHSFRSLEHNMFNGTVPPELGKLANLKNLSGFFISNSIISSSVLISWRWNASCISLYTDGLHSNFFFIIVHWSTINVNYLTGQLPMELSNLTNLEEMWVCWLIVVLHYDI